jgi:hypothetical protein
MADAATLFQTTLLVLYFTTPAETIHLANGKKTEYETTKIWTLQSTSQIPAENPDMCVANGLLLRQKFEQVSTVTIRLYCLCPENATSKECDTAKATTTKTLSAKGVSSPVKAGIIEIGPNTPWPRLRSGSGPAEQ